MIPWLLGVAVAATPTGYVRDGKPLKEGRIALGLVQVEGFAGGLFSSPDGGPVETPPWPDEVDLSAVAERAREQLHTTARGLGIGLTDTPAPVEGASGNVGVPPVFRPAPWDGWIPGDLQALLTPDRDADALFVVKLTLGWCPSVDAELPIVKDRGTLCVRARDTTLGEGPAGALGYLFLKRIDRLGQTITSRRTTVVAKRYDYARLADGLYADRPIRGRGETLQAQAEDAVVQAVGSLLVAATKYRRRR